MKRVSMMAQWAGAALFALLHPLATQAAEPASRALDERFTRSTLQIATADAKLHSFRIWVADNDTRRARGLMFVDQLEDDAGMLFVYPHSQPIAMWMKNTHIALDMVFVRADGRVHHIVQNTKPMSLDTIESNGDVLAVIELKGGTAAKLNIRPGAQVIHPAFGR